jgi:uncharacterized protein (TIGR00369 family)
LRKTRRRRPLSPRNRLNVEAAVTAFNDQEEEEMNESEMLVEMIRRMQQGEEPPPVAALIGFTLREVERGLAVIDFEANARHANGMGTLHGGILCDVADAAMGIAYAVTLGEGETFRTIELKINFLKPVRTGKLVATGRVVKAGRTVGFVECDVTDAADALVARATSTCMTLRPDSTTSRS